MLLTLCSEVQNLRTPKNLNFLPSKAHKFQLHRFYICVLSLTYTNSRRTKRPNFEISLHCETAVPLLLENAAHR